MINGKHFTPQNRERIVLVGFREPSDFKFDDLILEDFPMTSRRRSPLIRPMAASIRTVTASWTSLPGPARQVHAQRSPVDLPSELCRETPGRRQRIRLRPGRSARNDEDAFSQVLQGRIGDLASRRTGKNPRRLTPRECARLMGFDDDFIIPVSDTQAYKQFGNSVVVPAIAAVAELMKPHLPQSQIEDFLGYESGGMRELSEWFIGAAGQAVVRS